MWKVERSTISTSPATESSLVCGTRSEAPNRKRMRRHAVGSRSVGNVVLRKILITSMKSSSQAGKAAQREEVPNKMPPRMALPLPNRGRQEAPPLRISISTSVIRIKTVARLAQSIFMAKMYIYALTFPSKRP
jgi:hypothetical protein